MMENYNREQRIERRGQGTGEWGMEIR